MKVVGLCGYSGSGKTTLAEQLIARLKLAGRRVAVIKHAHHAFDIDQPGKDSRRHREAGAQEVVIASNRRMAKIRDYDSPVQPSLHELIAELSDTGRADLWVLVEGFKHGPLPKLEVWRQAVDKPVQYPTDRHVVAIATDRPDRLPVATALPILALDDVDAVVDFLLRTEARYDYPDPHRPSAAADAA